MLRVPNPAVRWVLLGAAAFLPLAILLPFARRLFHFAPLHLPDLLLSLGAGLVCVLWFEVVKRVRRRGAGQA
jgi:Ca2+-transporting ATPase